MLATPYAGLLGYVLVPAFFLLGLALIPLGMWREGRRRRLGRAAWSWPAVDLGQPGTRRVVAAVGVLTLINLGVVAVASVGVVHYTESNQFCGAVCHTPMTPQFTAHAFSPHSRVECVSCHVAPGAKGLISAKLNGTRQLYEFMLGSYNRPIPEPIGRIPGRGRHVRALPHAGPSQRRRREDETQLRRRRAEHGVADDAHDAPGRHPLARAPGRRRRVRRRG